ncbi:MAG TPA: YcjX family protein [Acetobacteraceae bacterium]|nr:YcjX family protein [Acetobacteraceae bacterium]
MSAVNAAADLLGVRSTVRVGVTGLARAGKTALLTSIAANLMALGAGRPALPALADRLGGRALRVIVAPAEASGLPRFDFPSHLAALAADPPRWPERTTSISLLALDLDLPRDGLLASLGPRMRRLEFLDYPGEWLLDLPLLSQDFTAWSAATLRRLEAPELAGMAREFLGFTHGLPAGAAADEALALSGHRLYAALLRRLRDEAGLSFLQPGRFLMPPPGATPPFMHFFPTLGRGALADLLRARFDAYVEVVRRDLISPLFGDLDRLVVLADLLSALHQGQAAFADVQAALAAASAALRWGRSWTDWLAALARFELPPRAIGRVTFVATKADHVAARQRGNLAALMRRLTSVPEGEASSAAFAVASVRCTEDVVETLDGRPVSAVRGRIIGESRPARSYPGEVPDAPPDAAFWQHRFLALPDFEPLRPPEDGRGGVPQLGLDALLAFLLADIL